MDCATHSGVAAVSTCTRCHRPMCGTCRESLDGSDYCASCVTELKAKLSAPADTEAGPEPQLAFTPMVAETGSGFI